MGVIQGTLGVIQGTLGVTQGTLGVIQGTLGVIQGTLGVIQGQHLHTRIRCKHHMLTLQRALSNLWILQLSYPIALKNLWFATVTARDGKD